MYCSSMRSSRKIVHTENCYLSKRLIPENVIPFETLCTAFSAGYRLCRHCNPIVRLLRSEEDALYDFCMKNGMSFRCHDRDLAIASTISNWIITVSPAGQTMLFHKNTKVLSSDHLSPVPGYHDQRISYDTLLPYFVYIKNHDHFRHAHPEQISAPHSTVKEPPRKGTKRWNKEQRRLKNQKRRQSVHNVLDIINSFDSSYTARR